MAHLYLFSEASPSNWLATGNDEAWRTVVNFVFESDPDLQEQIDGGETHIEVLSQDLKYTSFIKDLESHLPNGALRKWNARGGYKSRLCYAVGMVMSKYKPIVSACSFQEKTLRASKAALLGSYNRNIGASESEGTGSEKFKDTKGRLQKRRSSTSFHSYQEVQSSENQMLGLLFMSWFIGRQYRSCREKILKGGHNDVDILGLTIVSDKLSGDDDSRLRHEQNLRKLIDPEGKAVKIALTRSTLGIPHSGDLLADNLTGWLNAAISDPKGEFAQKAKGIDYTGIWDEWSLFLGSVDKPEFVPALSYL
ncbi:MAG: hypothetical protein ACLQO6_05585 [Desulfomonilaceae bacterium]